MLPKSRGWQYDVIADASLEGNTDDECGKRPLIFGFARQVAHHCAGCATVAELQARFAGRSGSIRRVRPGQPRLVVLGCTSRSSPDRLTLRAHPAAARA
jgi:hypothetical protein